jgi:hypothetical protein
MEHDVAPSMARFRERDIANDDPRRIDAVSPYNFAVSEPDSG